MVETVIYNPTIIFVKTSILLQYITVFVAHRRNFFHYACHILIWVNVLFYTIMTFSYMFECKPRRKLWIPHTPGHCRNEHARGLFSGGINVASDFLILILPLPVLLRLQMPSGKKLRLLLVFGVGLAACVASIVRLVYTVQINPDVDSSEYQLQINKEGLCAMAEIAIGIIVGCMPHVHKSFRHFSAQMASFSAFNVFFGSTGSFSWRRLLSRPSTSEASTPQKRFGSDDSGSVPPQIRTLNMTRASFTLDEKEFPQTPSPVHNHKTIPRNSLRSSDMKEISQTIEIEDVMPATETLSTASATAAPPYATGETPWEHPHALVLQPSSSSQTQPAPLTKRILTLDILSAIIGRELSNLAHQTSLTLRDAKLITVHFALPSGFPSRESALVSDFRRLELDFIAGGPQPEWMIHPHSFYVENHPPQRWDVWSEPVFDDLQPQGLEGKEEVSWGEVQQRMNLNQADRLLKQAGYRGTFEWVDLANPEGEALRWCFQKVMVEPGVRRAVVVEVMTRVVRRLGREICR
ncbi:MAG: hypothetical protein Q9181_003189 [Wetmoreana brouardii]